MKAILDYLKIRELMKEPFEGYGLDGVATTCHELLLEQQKAYDQLLEQANKLELVVLRVQEDVGLTIEDQAALNAWQEFKKSQGI